MIEEFERLIRRDPARRGLIGSEEQHGPLCPGHLAGAAADLAARGERAVIVTGFFIPRGDPPAAETDGPPGAVFLARALGLAGIPSVIATDPHCAAAVTAAARAARLEASQVWIYDEEAETDGTFWTTGPGRGLTHLIAIERVGPSHTPASLAAQPRSKPAPLDEFLARVPADEFDHCHNMRGEIIDGWTAGLHRLFEQGPEFCPGLRTIGIGDGGNEIGMGAIPWEDLAARLSGEQAARIPCRIATDWNILAGTSNWGGYALGAAVLLLRGRVEGLDPFDPDHERLILEQLVEHGPAVDGVTRRREPTVDGLPFLTYIQPWEGIRRLLHE